MPQAAEKSSQRPSSESFQHDSIISDTLTTQQPAFPVDHQLIVTTKRGVYAWDMSGVTELFNSGTGGIVAAKKVNGSNANLAIADSQVVVLHDIDRRKARSYKLKGSEGHIRLLKYTGEESQNLFFTTSLQNSIQAFSLKSSKLLPAQATHPSPPVVFTLSCDSHLLISTSLRPPTIYIRNIATSTPPVLLRPRCSPSAVVAATFHPERVSIFLLAFADGAIAVYDATRILRRNGMAREKDTGSAGGAGEIASLKRLHTPTTKALSEDDIANRGYDTGTGNVTVTADQTGITSVSLLPGHKAMAVTAGSDGKCCVVDFSQPNKNRAVLMKTWHLRRPITCLSVVYARERQQVTQYDGSDDTITPSHKDYCIAVGRQDGKVLLFDLEGTLLGQRILDPQRSRIIDVEWAKKGTDAAFAERNATGKGKLKDYHDQMRKSIVEELKEKKKTTSHKPADESSLFDFYNHNKHPQEARESGKSWNTTVSNQQTEGNSDDWSPHPKQPDLTLQHLDLEKQYSTLRMDMHSLLQPSYDEVRSGRDHTGQEQFETNKVGDLSDPRNLPSNVAREGRLLPSIPPRPMPKEGGRLYTRRAQKALEAAGHKMDGTPTKNGRPRSSGSSRSSHRVSTAVLPRSKPVLMKPRPKRKSSIAFSHLERTSRRISTNPSERAPEPLHVLPNGTVIIPSQTSTATWKTAPSQPDDRSEQTSSGTSSSGTVVDWSAGGVAQQSMPTVDIPREDLQPFRERDRNGQQPEQKKGHISLPVSSTSASQTSSSANTTCHWPHHQTHPNGPRPQPRTATAVSPKMVDIPPLPPRNKPQYTNDLPENNEGGKNLDADDPTLTKPFPAEQDADADADATTTFEALTQSATAHILEVGGYDALSSPEKASKGRQTRVNGQQHGRRYCECGADLHEAIERGFEGLREEVRGLFEEQRGWMERRLNEK